MLGEPICGALAGNLGIATHVVPSSMVEGTAAELAATLANGPTKAYAAVRTLLKAWSAGGVPAADAVMLDITMPLHATEDVTRGFINTAKAFDENIEPPAMIFHVRSVPVVISHGQYATQASDTFPIMSESARRLPTKSIGIAIARSLSRCVISEREAPPRRSIT